MSRGNTEDLLQIRNVLKRFQEGYTLRDTEGAEAFVDELYVPEDSTFVLGTGTGELFLGRDKVVELIKDDWSYWGDVRLKIEEPHITIEDEFAWIVVQGSVKYSFEHTPERYDSYLNFIKQRIEDKEASAEQKLTFLNWALMLTYHQREDKKREYLWPLCLSGVLKKTGDKWRFVQQHFSITVANYPDERFEASRTYKEAFQDQNSIALGYNRNQSTDADILFLKAFEQTFFGQNDITEEALREVFSDFQDSLVIGVDQKEYSGREQIKSYFENYGVCKLTLSTEHSIVSRHKHMVWITVTGTLEQDVERDIQAEKAIELLRGITESDASSKDKIFLAQRQITYLLKEISFGKHYTYPLRMSFVLDNSNEKTMIRMLHLSHPSYWVFEGKLN